MRGTGVGARFRALLAASALAMPMAAQTTQGLISGRITNSVTAEPVAHAVVTCLNPATNTYLSVSAGSDGFYVLPLLPPGVYELEVRAPGLKAKGRFELDLGVASTLSLDFVLRPLENILEPILPRTLMLPGERLLVNLYGPDVDQNFWTTYSPNPGQPGKLEASMSYAVRPADIQQLPLEGNNIYSILLAEPGVAASNSTSRSLGISANGMRPSSSSFLLDGLDTNLYLISGPLVTVAPEAVQEYRLSTNSFSAEYGGTAGYIANAVTRAGGAAWHGQAYLNFARGWLNANEFQDNVNGYARRPSRRLRPGFFAGGPVKRDRLFFGLSGEYFGTRDQMNPVDINLPNQSLLDLAGCPAAKSIACRLLRDYAVPASTAQDPYVAPVTFEPPEALDRWLALARIDYNSGGERAHGMARAALAHVSQPDFIWSPYPDYLSALRQPVLSMATQWTFTLTPTAINQLTAGWSGERIAWARAHPEVPTLISGLGNTLVPVLPGSPAAYGFDNRSRTAEVHDEQVMVLGKQVFKAGAGVLLRRVNDLLNYGQGGEYTFGNVVDFAFDQPAMFTAALSRLAPNFVQPDLDRAYREDQLFGFVEDTLRISPRLVLNGGLRYDNLGGPVSIGPARDSVLEFGAGATIADRVRAAQLVPAAANSVLYPGANGSFAPRAGFSYDISPNSGTLLRGGFGVFHDRIFDNLWLNARNNSFVFDAAGFPVMNADYLTPVSAVLPSYARAFGSQFPNLQFPYLTAFQKPMPNGYAENFFLGIQQPAGRNWFLEANGAGSLGRKLITTDVLNFNSLENPKLGPINWLSSQGLSDYYALSVLTAWRGQRGFLQAAWTWSHAIDNQSDPLAGDFFDLLFINPGGSAEQLSNAGFSHPADSSHDRGNADFDQRHTLVLYGSYSPPAPALPRLRRVFGGWTFSGIGAVRSGFPYSIYAISSDPAVLSTRARAALLPAPQPVAGGERIFDASTFCAGASCPEPESGRNAFAGPGLVNLDLCLARVLRLRWLGESGAVHLRADFFNALNHPNLNPPGNIPGNSGYGIALYGTPAANAGFPALAPLAETARQIQLLVRVTF